MTAKLQHLDAAQTIFFTRQLEEIDAKMYDVKYAALEAFTLVPVKSDIHPGAETYTYRQWDGRGMAEITSNYASGSPRADVSAAEFTSRIKGVRNSYGYNVQEIRAAAMANVPLEQARAITARRVLNEKINRITLLGDAAHNLLGLFTQPNAQEFVIPANGAGGSRLWASKTADQILADLYGMVDQIPSTTNEIEKPNRILLPYSVLRYISTKRVGVDTRDTVLDVFKIARPGIEVRGALYLDTAGANGTKRAVVYNASPEALELILPIAFESFPPEQRSLEFVIENHARVGGVVLRFPMSMLYADAF